MYGPKIVYSGQIEVIDVQRLKYKETWRSAIEITSGCSAREGEVKCISNTEQSKSLHNVGPYQTPDKYHADTKQTLERRQADARQTKTDAKHPTRQPKSLSRHPKIPDAPPRHTQDDARHVEACRSQALSGGNIRSRGALF